MTADIGSPQGMQLAALTAALSTALAAVPAEAWRSELLEDNEPIAPDIHRVFGDDDSLEATPIVVQATDGAAALAHYLTVVSPHNMALLLQALSQAQRAAPADLAEEVAALSAAYKVYCGDLKPALDTAFVFAAGFTAARRLPR